MALNLNNSRVLVSNDDGINAPGMKVLERIIKPLFKEVWVVAPETEQSASSHSLTLRSPLRIRKISKQRFGVNGTPADSVLLGVSEVMRECQPDIILSGVNKGGNIGEDVIYSGTVAAAMEGALLGIPSIAFSQVTSNNKATRWTTAEYWLPIVLKQLAKVDLPINALINVNFPFLEANAVSGIEVTCQGQRKIGGDLTLGTDPRGNQYFWVGPQRKENQDIKGTDLEAVVRGAISITPLTTDLTHRANLKKLKAAFK